METAIQCSCGDADHHVVARRMTADGIGVAMLDDGATNASTMAKINAGVAITEDEAAELDHDAALYGPGEESADHVIEYLATGLGMWVELRESTARTGFRMSAVRYTKTAAHAEVERMIELGWERGRVRVARAAVAS